jgi:hypothetical protein
MMATNDHRTDRGLRSRSMLTLGLLMLALTGCSEGGGGLADNGGMSGTGISQGAITAFGSIFVNGVEWSLSGASIEVDGRVATEADLRVGMVVRVEGDFAAGNASGTAIRVLYDDSVEGPIAAPPVETIPGVEKTFPILGRTVTVNALATVFADGATFDALAKDDVLEVTGFEDASGAIQATRVQRKSPFPGNSEVELRGSVATLDARPDDTGDFMLGSILVHYDATTAFDDVTRATLADGDLVEVEGTLRASGNDIDARRIERESDDLGSNDLERVEIEGFVVSCPSAPEYCVGNVPIDDSMATFEPVGFTPVAGDRVEVEGALQAGVLRADRVESENESEGEENVRIEAAVTSVDTSARTLEILGVRVAADAETVIEDKSSIEDESFQLGEIRPGDWLEVRGVDDGGPNVRALSIARDDATPGEDTVELRGPVTALDPGPSPPDMSILGQPIPLDAFTLYFDASDASRTEEQFFRSPGDLMIGDVVSVRDQKAASLSTLSEADEVELESP